MRSNKALSGNPKSTRTSEIRIVTRFVPLILSVLLLAAPSCRMLVRETFKSPKVRFVSARLSANPFLTKDPLEVVLHLEVTNPNSYALNISRAVYSVTIGNQELASGEKNEQFRLEPSRETIVTVPVTLNPGAFMSAMHEVIEARAVPYGFNGSLEVEAPLAGIVRVPFSKTGAFDLLDFIRKKKIPSN